MTQHITQEQIRAAGGIVHRDGNIFFTNIDQLNAALAQPASAPAAVSGWKLVPVEADETMLAVGDMNLMCGAADVYRAMLAAAPTGEPG